MQYVLSLSKTINLVLSTGSTQERPDMTEKLLTRRKFQLKKKIKKHYIKRKI